jgi:hypothetical protein
LSAKAKKLQVFRGRKASGEWCAARMEGFRAESAWAISARANCGGPSRPLLFAGALRDGGGRAWRVFLFGLTARARKTRAEKQSAIRPAEPRQQDVDPRACTPLSIVKVFLLVPAVRQQEQWVGRARCGCQAMRKGSLDTRIQEGNSTTQAEMSYATGMLSRVVSEVLNAIALLLTSKLNTSLPNSLTPPQQLAPLSRSLARPQAPARRPANERAR